MNTATPYTKRKHRAARLLYALMIIAVVTFTFSSCSKHTEDGAGGDSSATIIVSVSGLRDPETPNPRLKKMSLTHTQQNQKYIRQQRILENNGIQLHFATSEEHNSAFGTPTVAPVFNNSVLFGNIVSWLLMQSQVDGVNTP